MRRDPVGDHARLDVVVDKVAPVGPLVTQPRILIPTIIATCLAIDHDDGNFNCQDEQASP